MAEGEAEMQQLNEVIGELYSTFTAKVTQGRKLDPEATEQVARGRIWSGVAAKACGLIDELGHALGGLRRLLPSR